jgi:hypothetical protein
MNPQCFRLDILHLWGKWAVLEEIIPGRISKPFSKIAVFESIERIRTKRTFRKRSEFPKRKEKKMKGRLAIWVTWYMISVMFLIGIAPGVYADFSPSELMTLSQIDRNADLLKVQKALESKKVRERLSQLGFTEEGIQQRLNQLSDSQIHQIALKIDELKVGGDTGEAIIIGFVVVIFIVAIVYFLGYRLVLKQ